MLKICNTLKLTEKEQDKKEKKINLEVFQSEIGSKGRLYGALDKALKRIISMLFINAN